MNNPNESAGHTTPQEPPQVTITTLPFELTPKVYTQILLRVTFWKYWWQLVLIAVVALHFLVSGYAQDLLDFLFLVVFVSVLLLWPLFAYYRCRSLAHNPSNKPTMRTRFMTLAQDRIVTNEPDSGSVGAFTKDEIFAIEKCGNFYLVWVTQLLMLYLPKNAFMSQEDIETFESEILPCYKKLKRSFLPGFIRLVIAIVSFIVIVWMIIQFQLHPF